MRSKLNRLMIAALVLNYSCVSSDEPAPELVASEVAESRQAIVDTAPASYWPVPGLASASGFQKTWDGSTAELLAADALVSCWSSLPQAMPSVSRLIYAMAPAMKRPLKLKPPPRD